MLLDTTKGFVTGDNKHKRRRRLVRYLHSSCYVGSKNSKGNTRDIDTLDENLLKVAIKYFLENPDEAA